MPHLLIDTIVIYEKDEEIQMGNGISVLDIFMGLDFDHLSCGKAIGYPQDNDHKSSGNVNLDNYNDAGELL